MEIAQARGGKSMVFTFSNHPLSVLAPENMPPQIGSSQLRSRLIAQLGVDVLMAVPFTKQLAQRTPEAFLAMLRDSFAPCCVVTGPNYTFGSRGKGTHRMLLRDAAAFGFDAEVCPAVMLDGRTVSSTRIRALLQQGKLEEAAACLGRPFTVLDRVIHGERRGRTLGFPTANLAITDAQVMLPNGVYATRVCYEGKAYLGLANIGNNPTFEGCNRRLEVHIEDFRRISTTVSLRSSSCRRSAKKRNSHPSRLSYIRCTRIALLHEKYGSGNDLLLYKALTGMIYYQKCRGDTFLSQIAKNSDVFLADGDFLRKTRRKKHADSGSKTGNHAEVCRSRG